MWSNITYVKVDPSRVDQLRRGLHEQLIPMIQQRPGFVAGYWLEPIGERALGITFWESEQAARESAALGSAQGAPAVSGLSIERIETRQVAGRVDPVQRPVTQLIGKLLQRLPTRRHTRAQRI